MIVTRFEQMPGDKGRGTSGNFPKDKETHMRIWHVVKCLLIRRVSLLEVVNHEIAMTCEKENGTLASLRSSELKERPELTQSSPNISTLRCDSYNPAKVFCSFLELFL